MLLPFFPPSHPPARQRERLILRSDLGKFCAKKENFRRFSPDNPKNMQNMIDFFHKYGMINVGSTFNKEKRKVLIMNRFILCKLISLAIAAFMLTSGLTLITAVSVSAEENNENAENKTIVITLDPGHGPQKTGTNGAVQYGGVNEHFYNYSMALYAKERLEQYRNVEVHLTRTADNTPELSERPATAAQYNSDAFVSIHINSANKTANGTEIWVPNNNWRPEIAEASRAAATPVLENIISTFGLTNRGFKTSNSATGTLYPDGTLADKLTVIKGGKEHNIPVVMLIEVAFADNQSDYEKVFATEEGLQKAGYAIADGLARYYGLEEAPTTEFIHASNDELRYIDAEGNQIGQAFEPGQFDAWTDKVIEFEEGSVANLVDWGWTAFKSENYRYAYIINGEEYTDESFAVEAEQAVLDAIAGLKAPNGSRFMGTLPTEKLNPGENTVQFVIKLDEDIIEVIREYTVIVTEKVTEAPTEPPTEAPTEAPTEEITDEAPNKGCGAALGISLPLLLTLCAGWPVAVRESNRIARR